MQNLIERISSRTGMDKEKATVALLTISDYVKGEFPLLQSVVDLILGTQGYSLPDKQPIVANFHENPIIYN